MYTFHTSIDFEQTSKGNYYYCSLDFRYKNYCCTALLMLLLLLRHYFYVFFLITSLVSFLMVYKYTQLKCLLTQFQKRASLHTAISPPNPVLTFVSR